MTPQIGIFGAGYPEYGPGARLLARFVPIGRPYHSSFAESSSARAGSARACMDTVVCSICCDSIMRATSLFTRAQERRTEVREVAEHVFIAFVGKIWQRTRRYVLLLVREGERCVLGGFAPGAYTYVHPCQTAGPAENTSAGVSRIPQL